MVIGVYAPNGMSRPDYRTNEWDPDFLKFVCTVKETTKKEIIILGDLNVSHHDELDLGDSHRSSLLNKQRRKMDMNLDILTAEQEEQRRNNFSNLLSSAGLVDTFRHLYPTKKEFTYYWSRSLASEDNRDDGRRLDYALVTNTMLTKLKDLQILIKIEGSDHCPIELHLKGMMCEEEDYYCD